MAEDKIKQAHSTLFDEGIKMRYKVAGKEYVDRALENGSSDFARPMQEVRFLAPPTQSQTMTNYVHAQLVTESCWGSIWTRPGLELKTRSLLNLAILCALNRSPELGVHVRGALNNGASEVEIREVILQAAFYCGMPAGMEGTKVAEKVVKEWKAERGIEGPVLGGEQE